MNIAMNLGPVITFPGSAKTPQVPRRRTAQLPASTPHLGILLQHRGPAFRT